MRFANDQPPPPSPPHIVDRRVVSSIRAPLGSHVGKPSFAYGQVFFFPGFSGFCPPLMNGRLDISEIFLKEP